MKTTRIFLAFFMVLLPMLAQAQVNPFLKKYAGSYYVQAFGEEDPTETTEKINLTLDGKWTSRSFPVSEDGVVSKTPVNKAGTWKASEGLIQLSFADKGAVVLKDFKLDDGLFMSDNTFLTKIFVSNPAFLQKYAGTYQLLQEGEEPGEATITFILSLDGKAIKNSPAYDQNGTLSKTPTKELGSWKANDGIIKTFFKDEEGKERSAEYKLDKDVFRDRSGDYLKKPVPPGYHLKLYAGTYHMLADGQTVSTKTDKYILTADGKGTWTFYNQAASSPTVKPGTWKASEGLIQLFFTADGGGDHGGELLTDFRLQDGVFRAEGVFLKKLVAAAGIK